MNLLPSIFEKPKGPFAFEEFFDFLSEKGNGNWASIRMDVKETPAEYIVKADLPGIKKDEINVSLLNQILTISVDREEEEEEKDFDFLIRERRYQSMKRSIPLGFAGTGENVKAEFKDGVLEVHVKKSPEKQTKRIPIQ